MRLKNQRYKHRNRSFIIVIVCLILVFSWNLGYASNLFESFTDEEQKWLIEHQGETFNLGLDPYSGMDYFMLFDKKVGYIIDTAKLLERELDIKINIVDDQSWGEVYDGLQTGDIDILFGANATEERLEFMSFTDPILKNPYVVFANKNSDVQTIGDLDLKKIAFIEGDIVIDAFPVKYFNIKYETVIVENQIEGLNALNKGLVEGFITSGGGVEYEYLYENPMLQLIAEISAVTSDMTFSTLKKNQILSQIIDKTIKAHRDGLIEERIIKASINYNRKILGFTKEEIQWIESDHNITVGVANDYLPFEYTDGTSYLGISGDVLNKISNISGFDIKIVEGNFAQLYEKAEKGEIDILNMAKTENRIKIFDFTVPYCEERDEIYGRKESAFLQDVYELEDKTVAVIEGFWHEEYLRKNLYNINIMITESLDESLRLLDTGRVDYIIENPTVAEFYITGLGYDQIVKKGSTSKDSFFYFGMNKNKPYLTSVINKAMVFVDINRAKESGLQTVPELTSNRVKNLFLTIGVLTIVILLGVIGMVRLVTVISMQKVQTELLKERERLLYIDPLSQVYNRQYYSSKENLLDAGSFPQTVVLTDLNSLKKINDLYGHHAGDIIIREFGRILLKHAGTSVIIRMGGDEFLILHDSINEEQVLKWIQIIKNEFLDSQIDSLYKKYFSASFGYFIRTNKAVSLEEAIKKADILMYQDKKMMKSYGDEQ